MEPIKKNNADLKRQNRMVYTIMAASLAVLGILIAISVMSARRADTRRAMAADEQTSASPAAVSVVDDGVPAALEVPDVPHLTDEGTGGERVKESANANAGDEVPAASDSVSALPSFIPVAFGKVSKGFSMDVPVWSNTMGDYRAHRGIDISVPLGADVFAAAGGTVSAVWEDPMAGCAMRIEHDGGAVSTYYNLSRETIEVMKPGMEVVSGCVIGSVGDTSLLELADEPHVHYELTINGEYVDPCEYMDFTSVEASYGE